MGVEAAAADSAASRWQPFAICFDSLRRGLFMNAVEVQLASKEFPGALVPYPGDTEFRDLASGPDIFVYRLRGMPHGQNVLVVPLSSATTLPGGAQLTQLPVARFRPAICSLIERHLPRLLPEGLGLVSKRFSLERVKRNEDLLELALRRASIPRPTSLLGVSKHMRTRMQLRTEFIRGRGPGLVMTIQFSVASAVDGSLANLVDRGVHVDGLRTSYEEEVGYVVSVCGNEVVVETEEGESTWPSDAVAVAGSSDAVRRIFESALTDSEREAYHAAEAQEVAARTSGQAYIERLRAAAGWLSQQETLSIGDALSFKFGGLIPLPERGRDSAVSQLDGIRFCFSRDRTALDTIPSRGLESHGPSDGDTFDRKEPNLLVVYPDGHRAAAEGLMRSIRDGLPRSRAFARGFVSTFRLSRLQLRFLAVPLDGAADPGAVYLRALTETFDPSLKPDAAIVLLRDQDSDLPDSINPYVATKAWLLSQGIASQEIRLSKARETPNNLQYILQDLCVALYAKLGGSPWTVLPSTPLAREVVVGVAYSESSARFRERKRYMGIATVFSSDGTYILGASSPQCGYDEYPAVLADTVGRTMRRLAADQSWSRGDLVRLVFHMGKPLTRQDISTLKRVATSELVDGVEFETAFLNIRQRSPFVLADPSQTGRRQWVDTLDGRFGQANVGAGVPGRGVVVDLGRSRRLLCVTGPQQLKREGGAHPAPLLIDLHRDSSYTELHSLTRQVFQFTGLSWKSVRPISEPVTLSYPRLIARLVSRLSTHDAWSPDLINTHLLRSRWFL